MRNPNLRLDPQHARHMDDKRLLDPGCWFYEEDEGISVYVEGDYGVTSHLIPLRAIRAYISRIEMNGDTN